MKSLPAVLVLGAGQGRRYHGVLHKLAEPLGTYSVLGHTVRNALASGLPVVVVTTPPFAAEASGLVASRDVVVLHPGDDGATGGMGDSIAAGVAARAEAAGWLILPADMPLVRPASLRKVAAALAHHAVAFAQYKGERGHPVGFSSELFSDLVRLTGDVGARRVVARYPAQPVELDDPGVVRDLDTTSDLHSMREAWASSTGLAAE